MWQQIIVGAIVLIALGYLLRRFLRSRKAEPGCAHCKLMHQAKKPLHR